MANDMVTISNGDNCNNIIVLEVMVKIISIVNIGCIDDRACDFLSSKRGC